MRGKAWTVLTLLVAGCGAPGNLTSGPRVPNIEEDQQQKFPWGNEYPSASVACYQSGSTCPVGSKPAGASKLGIQDLAGNVREWTDRCVQGFHGVCEYRGGSYSDSHFDLYSAVVYHADPTQEDVKFGFRCAR